MADVQKTKGTIQIANHLFEAIIDGGFNEQQFRILLALLRLTYGWNKHAVRMPELELARASGGAKSGAVRSTGSFRLALKDLLDNHVMVRIATEKRGVFVWAINKNFETWVDRSSTMSKLVARWNERPQCTPDDRQVALSELARFRATDGEQTEPEMEEEEWPESGPDEWPESRPHKRPDSGQSNEVEWPCTGEKIGPRAGQIDEAKSFIGETYDSWKDRKDSSTPLEEKDHQTVASVVSARTADENAAQNADANDANSEANRQYAIGLSTAANRGIGQRWGEQTRLLQYASGLTLAEELRAANVPLELARLAITSMCLASKAERPPMRVLGYFRAVVFEAHRDAEQRAFNAADPGARRGGDPTAMAALVRAATGPRLSDEQRIALNREYDGACREAALAWGKDPANAAEYQRIVELESKPFVDLLETAWGKRGRWAAIIAACAQRVAFPSFEAWCEQREQQREQREQRTTAEATSE